MQFTKQPNKLKKMLTVTACLAVLVQGLAAAAAPNVLENAGILPEADTEASSGKIIAAAADKGSEAVSGNSIGSPAPENPENLSENSAVTSVTADTAVPAAPDTVSPPYSGEGYFELTRFGFSYSFQSAERTKEIIIGGFDGIALTWKNDNDMSYRADDIDFEYDIICRDESNNLIETEFAITNNEISCIFENISVLESASVLTFTMVPVKLEGFLTSNTTFERFAYSQNDFNINNFPHEISVVLLDDPSSLENYNGAGYLELADLTFIPIDTMAERGKLLTYGKIGSYESEWLNDDTCHLVKQSSHYRVICKDENGNEVTVSEMPITPDGIFSCIIPEQEKAAKLYFTLELFQIDGILQNSSTGQQYIYSQNCELKSSPIEVTVTDEPVSDNSANNDINANAAPQNNTGQSSTGESAVPVSTNTVTRTGGETVASTVQGVYTADSINGAVIITPVSGVKAAVGIAEPNTNIVSYFCDSRNKDINAALRVTATEQGRHIAAIFNADMYSITLQGQITAIRKAAAPVRLVFGVPARLTEQTFSVICRDENGETVIFEDMDTDPNTISIDANVFGIYALVY